MAVFLRAREAPFKPHVFPYSTTPAPSIRSDPRAPLPSIPLYQGLRDG